MQTPQDYPLPQDSGFPAGVRAARERWADVARGRRRRSYIASLSTVIGTTLLFGFLGLMPWLTQRAASPRSVERRLSRPLPPGNGHLGAEYYNIASAIVNGRGFSDPFIVESGPTAWMPPMLVWLQAVLIWMLDQDRFLVMCAVVTLKTLLLAFFGAVVVHHAWKSRRGWKAVQLFCFFIFAEFWACFAFTHDGWLILVSVTGTTFGLAALHRMVARGAVGFGTATGWGIVGGLVALTSPIAGFTWAVGTTACLMRKVPSKWLVAGAVSVAVITPWAIRNQIALGKFVPVKSNAFYEFDQSLTLDSDGLLDWGTMNSHPYHAGPEQKKYLEMGEIAYLETKKERFLSGVKANPSDYARKVFNRFIGTTLWPAGFSGFHNPLRWLIYPWAAIAVVYLLAVGRPLGSLQRYAIICYCAYLFPYILCSYYPRYGFPLFIIKVLLCFWALELWGIRKRRNDPAPLVPVTAEPPVLESPVSTNPDSVWQGDLRGARS